MVLLCGKYVLVWVSELRAVVSWGVGTEGKLWGRKNEIESACVTACIKQVKGKLNTRIQLLLFGGRGDIRLSFGLRLFKDNRSTGGDSRRFRRWIK